MTETAKDRITRLMCEARDIVGGSRQAAYGPPERNFGRIAVLWEAYLAAAYDLHRPVTLKALDVCNMLDLVKLARLIQTPDHEDSIRDRFGYQACYVNIVYGDKAGGMSPEGWSNWPGYQADTYGPPDSPYGQPNVNYGRPETPFTSYPYRPADPGIDR